VDGYLLVDKPVNWTSFDVVAKVRGCLKASGLKKPKVGHTGTLDPLASGLLIIVLGSYCKRAAEFSKLDKTYAVSARLGQTSTTGDEEGQKTAVSDLQPTQEQIDTVLRQFTGEISQIPPAHSAIKVGGKRSYELARQGKSVQLAPRQVKIHRFTEVEYEYPRLSFSVSVSSGTYIRSLVQDIGQAFGAGAYTTQLRRLSVGSYSVVDAIDLKDLTTLKLLASLQTTV
jgi:tRNA pseudouridine55 synthase